MSEKDVESLRAFRRLYDETFTHNLLSKAKVTCNLTQGKPRFVVDGNYNTSVLPDTKAGKAVFTFQFKKPTTFNVLSVQEDIRKGQRVEAFTLEVKNQHGMWQKVTEGTTIGHKRLLKFPNETASEVRLTISEMRAVPAISEIGLYQLKE